MCLKERAWIEVDLDNLKWNVLQIKKYFIKILK